MPYILSLLHLPSFVSRSRFGRSSHRRFDGKLVPAPRFGRCLGRSLLRIGNVRWWRRWHDPLPVWVIRHLVTFTYKKVFSAREGTKSCFDEENDPYYFLLPSNVWYLRRTHLGHLLRPGDVVLGYDLRNSNTNDDEFEKIKRSGVSTVTHALYI